MPRCPSCESPRIVIRVDSGRQGLCVRCGTQWIQDGGTQRNVRRLALVTSPEGRSPPAVESVQVDRGEGWLKRAAAERPKPEPEPPPPPIPVPTPEPEPEPVP